MAWIFTVVAAASCSPDMHAVLDLQLLQLLP
jgi:hypothetical protein